MSDAAKCYLLVSIIAWGTGIIFYLFFCAWWWAEERIKAMKDREDGWLGKWKEPD